MGNTNSRDLPIPKKPNVVRDNIVYEIEIEIGKTKHSETDADVFIVLHGTHEVSNEIEIKGELHQRGIKKTISTKQNYLGEIWQIEVWKKDKAYSPSFWYLKKITVREGNNNNDWEFPAYRWILNQRDQIFQGRARLPQHEHGMRSAKERSELLEKKRGDYQWEPYGNLCSVLKADYLHLPLNDAFTDEKIEDFLTARNKVAASFMLDKFFENFHKMKKFEDFEEFFRFIPKPKCAKIWKSDVEFGRQRIQGAPINHLIKINDKIPSKFGVTTESVQKFLRPGTTLESEILQHRVYLLDYEILEHVEVQKGRFLCAPLCLLYVNGEDKLVPIAIQLHQKYDPVSNPLFTPADEEEDWLFAKMWVNCADINTYQVSSHFLFTHLIMEPTIIATHRNLSEAHPVYKLLWPHFRNHLGINSLARSTLITENGVITEAGPLTLTGILQLAERAYNTVDFKKLTFPEQLKSRGFNPTNVKEAPPGYYFLEDGMKLWNAILKFVQSVLFLYYKTSEDLAQDHEIQSWIEELGKCGFYNKDNIPKDVKGTFDVPCHHGLPDSITTLEELADILTIIIYQCSVTHATLNFAQYESFAFIPFSPGAIFFKPPGADGEPVQKSKITMKTIFKSLPPKAIAARQIAVLFLLSSYSDQTDQFLGTYAEELFPELEVKAEMANFREELERITKDIETRGEWDRMLPRLIPNSTAI